MNLSVRFLPEARQDVIDSRDWYEQQQEGLGALFSVALVDAVERIHAHPFRYPEVQGPIRRVILQRFPYAIYFRMEGTEIIVLAVHGRQDPKRWQERG